MKGLTETRATELLTQYGQNVIAEQKKKGFFTKFFEQFNNFLTLLLLTAAVLSFFIGETVDGALILAIVVLNALFGLYQEAKAEEAIDALKQITVTKVRVIRDGIEKEIDSKFLVPGDVIFMEEGVKVPADCSLLEAVNLEMNEAAMTGESLPVLKRSSEEVFMGTIVAKGRGYARVKYTGMQTKFGQIAQNLSQIDDTQTPLQKKLEELSRTIGLVGIATSLIVFILSLIAGAGYFPAFLLAISLAVAVVPEGLPAVMTITLSIGVKEMAKRKAIIRKLSAIEALGSVTLIATDKTGTLTTNKMKVKELYVDGKIIPEEKSPSLTNSTFSKIIMNGILCSTASLVYVHDHGQFDVLGDPTEGALLYLAQKKGLLLEMVRNEWRTIDESPFSSITKRMCVTVQKNEEVYSYCKGAPESVLEISNKIIIGGKEEMLTDERKKGVEEVLSMWAHKGLRVLAFSYSPNTRKEQDHIFLGMVGIHDPPRPEVENAIYRAKEAGIRVVMITGDNEKTAEAIGVSVGLMEGGDEIVTGKQIDAYTEQEFLDVLPKVKVFARTTPFHKHKIVKMYQDMGEIVAVTGDGVNDAIALKQADVGVAMGLVGTDVARETADMVISDDNFASIVNAVEEGRNIIKNLKNAIKYLLSCNISEALSLTVGLILGIPNLLFAIQLLYINLITDGVPALSLAFSPRHEGTMRKAPEKKLKLLLPNEMTYIFLVGIISTSIIIGSYYYFQSAYGLGKTATFSVLTLIQSFILIDLWLSHASLHKNIHKLFIPLFFIAFSIPFITQFTIVNVPFLASLFKSQAVPIPVFLQFMFSSALVLVGIKLTKLIVKV